MSRAKSLASDTLVLGFGTLSGRVLGILLLPLYTYCLTQAEFGTVDLIATSIDLVLPLVFLSVAEGVLRFAMSPEERSQDVLRTALTFVASGSALAVAAAAIATVWWPAVNVALVASIFIVQAFTAVLGTWGRATGQVRTYALSGVVQAFGVGCANVVFLLVLDLGVRGFLCSLLVGLLAGAGVLLLRLPCVSAVREAAFDRRLLRRMLLFSAPLVPNVVLWWLTNISGRYILAFTHGIDAVGTFGVASRFPALVVMVATVFTQAWQLAANRSVENERNDERGRFYSAVFRFYAATMILSISSVILVLKPLVRLAVSPAFYTAWEAVPALLMGAMFAAFASFYGVVYTAARQSGGIFRTTLAAGVGSLALNSLLIPIFGVVGVALSIALCFLGLWLLRVVDSQTITKTSISPRLIVPGLLLLAAQISLLYASLPQTIVYSFMVALWLGLALLFRSEIIEGGRRARGATKFFRTKR